ncbi:hypothetical protein F4801DRAFT_599184 [Xylaria longipes]|nr:hypothetical protein F4801DRAFT_599184 [Xylaria longipes]
MEPSGTLVRRERWLTNEPAEFVENGAALMALLELDEPPEELEDLEDLENITEYSPDLGGFVPKDTVLNTSRFYQESKRRKLEFQQRLERFARMLKDRNVDKELRIEIKDAKDFNLPYVLEIIDQIEKRTDVKRPYKAFVRRCFRIIEDNKAVIEGIISFVPDDMYGTLISGGFTLILATATSLRVRKGLVLDSEDGSGNSEKTEDEEEDSDDSSDEEDDSGNSSDEDDDEEEDSDNSNDEDDDDDDSDE